MSERIHLCNYHTYTVGRVPNSADLGDGEIAINLHDKSIFFKDINDEIVTVKGVSEIEEIIDTKIDAVIQEEVKSLTTNTELKFYCIEDVTVEVNGESTVYPANTSVGIFLNEGDTFTIIPTSDNSIIRLEAFPGALSTFYSWLEGVSVFDSILFDMNNIDMYIKWSQYNQGVYNVQKAQYQNCIFWSDLPYVNPLEQRNNYTLYYSSQLPLCFSTIPDNTYKPFYSAYGVTNDPNWSNAAYRNSYSLQTNATQTFSYYGLQTIGVYNMDSSNFNIPLPKDCRGLMFYAPSIENAGVFDATKTTNFGSRSGSWRDAFGYCYSLRNLYIKNLHVSINVSWSPINQDSLNYILDNATNTSNITIYLSPFTYYKLTDANKTLAQERNITLSLIENNLHDDIRFKQLETNKQNILVNGENIKTIAGENLLGEGDINILSCGTF